MYPLLLSPALKDYLWGGNRLPEEYGYQSDLEKVAEAWVLSAHPEGASRIENGALKGKTLADAFSLWGNTALGKATTPDGRFPILIKFIDAKDRLSVQVHPDDAYASAHSDAEAKTEMWVILDCEPGAKLLYGVNRELSKEEFARRIRDNTLDEVSRYVEVHKGDVFFIPAGTLHAIGSGILIAEVQQNSATTYRVSDYGRLGADGKPRPLHIDKALEVTNLTPGKASDFSPQAIEKSASSERYLMADCPFFTVETVLIKDGNPVTFGKADSFVSLLCLEGDGFVTFDGEKFPFNKGTSLFIPAGSAVTVSGKARWLYTFVK